jgi:hypothetical protein
MRAERHRAARAVKHTMTKYQIITAIGTAIALLIALYGAVLSTINFRRDRARVKLEVTRNKSTVHTSAMFGKITSSATVTLRITNVGRRPVTIVKSGAMWLYPNYFMAARMNSPPLPHEITEGKFIDTTIDQDIDFSQIDYWGVRDSHGRRYKLQEASWFKHWKSALQRKLNS